MEDKPIEEALRYFEDQSISEIYLDEDALVIEFNSGDQLGVAVVEGQLSFSYDV